MVPSLTAESPRPTPPIELAVESTGGGLLAVFVSGAVLAAVISACVTVVMARRKSREEERARVRTTLAEAYQAYAEYKEFPYAVRRRRADQPAAERVRLSEELRQVQARLSYYETWTVAESAATGKAYGALVEQMRKVAGGAIRDAWNAPAVDNDAGMNIGPDVVDLRALKPYEEAFIKAADAHVAALASWWWSRRAKSDRP